MKRKLTPLIACPELRHINKTMIIEIPLVFREHGHPIFRIVSGLDDLKNPKVKFKANDLLKIILEKDIPGKKLDTICVEAKKENLLKSTELLCEKSNKRLSDHKVPIEGNRTNISYQKLSEGGTEPDLTIVSSAKDNNSKQTNAQFVCASKNSSVEPNYLCNGLEAQKVIQRTSLASVTEQLLPVCKNFENTGSEYKTDQQLPGSAHLVSQEHEILQHKDAKIFGELSSHNCEPFKCHEDYGSSQEVNGSSNYGFSRKTINQDSASPQVTPKSNPVTTQGDFAFGTAQNRDFRPSQETDYCKGYRSFQQKEYHKPKSPHKKNPGLRPGSKRNCNLGYFQLSEGCDSGSSAAAQKSMMPPDPLCQHSDFSDFHQGSNHIHRSLSSADQIGMQRMPAQTSRFSNKKQHQVANENMYKSASEFPKHCFWKDLNWSEMKQILFLDIQSYTNFFREFEKIPPPGMHIWTFMPSTYKLKYPSELVNHRLLNMKLLHITLGDVNLRFSEVVYDLHCRLPLSVQFIIVSSRQFNIMESIKSSRTVNVVCPKFNEGMSEIYRYIFRVDA